MALYRCAACGSPNVVTDTQAGDVEYNYLKGTVGTVVLGAGGAAAGISSKQQRMFKCPDCGATLSYPMDEAVKIAIDAGVRSAEARERLTLYGVSAPWFYFTKKYRNIESGPADEQLKMQVTYAAMRKEINTQTMRIIADSILEDYQTLQVELALLANPENNVEERKAAWEITAKDVLDARQHEYDEAQKEEHDAYEKAVAKTEQDIQNQIAELSNANDVLTAETEKLQTELSSLGLFKGKRKKEINERLHQIEEDLASNNTKASELAESIVGLDHKLLQKMNDDLAARKARIDKKYPLEESPAEHKRKLLKIKSYFDGIKAGKYTDKKSSTRNCGIQVYRIYDARFADSLVVLFIR